jgi:hypothetical protein
MPSRPLRLAAPAVALHGIKAALRRKWLNPEEGHPMRLTRESLFALRVYLLVLGVLLVAMAFAMTLHTDHGEKEMFPWLIP